MTAYSSSTYLLNAVTEVKALCACCSQPAVSKTVWAQAGKGRKGVAANSITILRADDKVIELWAGATLAGEMPGIRGKAPTLATTAAALGGKWVMVRKNTMVRPEAISYWRCADNGANLLVDGVAIYATRVYWPRVRNLIALS
jgi:hypothetical protein